MGMFDKVNTTTETQEEKDRVKGQRQEPLASNIYELEIIHAYGKPARSGALGINLLLATPEGREIKITEWITSGDAKENKTYYEMDTDKGKVKRYLAGYLLIDGLSRIVAGKSILDPSIVEEEKTIPLWDYESKSEKPTKVDMITDLVGKTVLGAVLSVVEDRKKQGDDGKYAPTGKTFTTNAVEKFLNPGDKRTAIEMKNNLDAEYAETFLKKWEGKVDNRSKVGETNGQSGAPAASGAAATKTKLFD